MNREQTPPPTLQHKAYDEPSLFEVKGLLREARQQKNVPAGSVPEVGLLDPDGDIVRYLKAQGQARLDMPYRRISRAELARMPRSGSDCAAAARMGGKKPKAARDSPTTL